MNKKTDLRTKTVLVYKRNFFFFDVLFKKKVIKILKMLF